MEVKKVLVKNFTARYNVEHKKTGVHYGCESIPYISAYEFGTPEHEKDMKEALQRKAKGNMEYKLFRVNCTRVAIIDSEEYHRHELVYINLK